MVQLHVGQIVVLWMYLSSPLAVKSTICFSALFSPSLLSPSFVGFAKEGFPQAEKQLVVTFSAGYPGVLLLDPVVSSCAQSFT